ncbi:MAG: M3 family metallopeptidase [Bacteroidales bacterium]|nr:M3 family metallopeptidase [Bacteroidales bacterium]
MKKELLSLLLAGVCAVSCNNAGTDNPLLKEWNTPFGIPPFEQVKPEHYMPAFLEAMAQEKAEIDAIVNNTEEPDFENTILAFDNTGKLLNSISTVFSSDNGVNSNDELRAIAKELSPLTSAHSSEISLNDALFQRIKAVYEKKDSLGLRPDQMRLLTETYKGFERNGANLPADKKEELKKVNAELAALQLAFGQNLLQETAAYQLVVEKEEDLAGLTPNQIAEAAARAEKAGKAGKWIFGLDNPSVMPFLANAQNRELRKEILTAYLNRGNNGNGQDNNEVIKKLVELRLKKAQIMGYENYAQLALDNRMAKTEEAVYNLLDQIWAPALKVAKQEASEMVEIMKREGVNDKFEAWDWRYYAEKVKAEKYNLNESELQPYFQLENAMQGIFHVANKLYGFTFNKLENVPVPSTEAVAYEVLNKEGGHQGVIFFDMFARPGAKRGGAWCSTFRGQSYEDGKRVAPIVTIVGNFSRPVGDEPALLTTDEIETLFHEFGHGIDNLSKDVQYSGLRGYPRDFVEIHSQLNEHWAFEPEVLAVYAKHYKTGEVIPVELVEKMNRAGKYGQGFATTEYLAASYLDMDFHVLKSIPEDLDICKFEAKVLGDRGLLEQIPSRYKSQYFNHTFGGGYTAGYYSYIWAEVLDADAFEAFKETGDIFNQEVAARYSNELLKRAGEDDAMVLYMNFRGKEPSIDPLLANRGLK